jgi:hypothetical protein
MPSLREIKTTAELSLIARNPVQSAVHPIQKDDPTMKSWISRILPTPNPNVIAVATGISAGLLLLGSFTIAVDLGLLPESRRPNAWHWFLGLSMSSLASVGALTKLDQLQNPQGDRSSLRSSSGRGVQRNGSLYERTTTQLAVHLLAIEPGTQEFQSFTVASADVMNHVDRVHGTVHAPIPNDVHDSVPFSHERFMNESPSVALDALQAINQIPMETHRYVESAEYDAHGNPDRSNVAVVATEDFWGEGSQSDAVHAVKPSKTVIRNSFFGDIEC